MEQKIHQQGLDNVQQVKPFLDNWLFEQSAMASFVRIVAFQVVPWGTGADVDLIWITEPV